MKDWRTGGRCVITKGEEPASEHGAAFRGGGRDRCFGRRRARDRARVRQAWRPHRAAGPRRAGAGRLPPRGGGAGRQGAGGPHRRRRRRAGRGRRRAGGGDASGPIDIWVNDAMATVFARVVDTSPTEFKRATEVTYLGTVYGTMAALKRMTARDRGTIVQVGSALSYRAIPLQAAYCGSKFAIRGVHRLDPHRTASTTRATCTSRWSSCRGSTRPSSTGAAPSCPSIPQPVPPIYQPEIPAEAVYWAAHHRRRELWVGYSAVEAILGSRIAPGTLADIYLARTRHSRASRCRTCRCSPDRPDNLFEPVPDSRRPRTASSTTRPSAAARSCGRNPPGGAGRRALAARWRASSGAAGDRRCAALRRNPTTGPAASTSSAPHVLREYALLADGERGVLVGPRGDYAWMCFPRWDSDACFATLIGGAGHVRGDARGTLRLGRLLRARADLAQPLGHRRRGGRVPGGAGAARPRRDRAVLLRRILALRGKARVRRRARPADRVRRRVASSGCAASRTGVWTRTAGRRRA